MYNTRPQLEYILFEEVLRTPLDMSSYLDKKITILVYN